MSAEPSAPTTIDSDWSRWPNFSPVELRCHGSGMLILHPGFMDALQKLRDRFDHGMSPSSGCRADWYNKAEGGHPRSLHICDAPQHEGQLGTLATDIRTHHPKHRGYLFVCAWELGWSVGWGRGFLHLDRRGFIGLPQTTFDYY